MTRTRKPKTEEQKKVASDLMKRHWLQCELLAKRFDVDKTEINAHWSCCIKEALGEGATRPLSFKLGEINRAKHAYADCLLRKAKQTHDFVERCYQRQREEQRQPAVRTPNGGEPVPRLNQRVKVMLWAIRTVGGVENARDALERAIRALED